MYLFFYCLVYKKSILSWLNQCNSNWLSSLKLNTIPQFLGCFVKCFYFVWCKIITTPSCQKCVGESASIVVPTWWAISITKISGWIAVRWRIVGNVNVMASTESRSTRRALVYGMSVRTIPPHGLRQFHRCPSWLVNQREKECLGISSIVAAVTSWRNNKKKRIIRCTDFVQQFEFLQTRNKISDTTNN